MSRYPAETPVTGIHLLCFAEAACVDCSQHAKAPLLTCHDSHVQPHAPGPIIRMALPDESSPQRANMRAAHMCRPRPYRPSDLAHSHVGRLACRKRLLAQGKMTEADYGGPLPASDDEVADEYRTLGPRRRQLQRKEDRIMLWAWFR